MAEEEKIRTKLIDLLNTSSSLETDYDYVRETVLPSPSTRLDKVDIFDKGKVNKLAIFTDLKKIFDVVDISTKLTQLNLRTNFDSVNMIAMYKKNGTSMTKQTQTKKKLDTILKIFDQDTEDERLEVKISVVLFFDKTSRLLEAFSIGPNYPSSLLSRNLQSEVVSNYYLYMSDEPISDEEIAGSGLSESVKLFLYIGVPIIICLATVITVLICIFGRKKKRPVSNKSTSEQTKSKADHINSTNQIGTGSETEMLKLHSGKQLVIDHNLSSGVSNPYGSPLTGAYPVPQHLMSDMNGRPSMQDGSGGLPMIPIHNIMAKDSNGNPISVVYVMPSNTASNNHGSSKTYSMQSGSNLHSGLPSELPSLTGTLPGSGFTRFTMQSDNTNVTGFTDGSIPGEGFPYNGSRNVGSVSNDLKMFPVDEMPKEEDIQMFEVDIGNMGEYKPGGKQN